MYAKKGTKTLPKVHAVCKTGDLVESLKLPAFWNVAFHLQLLFQTEVAMDQWVDSHVKLSNEHKFSQFLLSQGRK